MKLLIMAGPASDTSALTEPLCRRYGMTVHPVGETGLDGGETLSVPDGWLMVGSELRGCERCFAAADRVLTVAPSRTAALRLLMRRCTGKLSAEEYRAAQTADRRYRSKDFQQKLDIALAYFSYKRIRLASPRFGRALMQKLDALEKEN